MLLLNVNHNVDAVKTSGIQHGQASNRDETKTSPSSFFAPLSPPAGEYYITIQIYPGLRDLV